MTTQQRVTRMMYLKFEEMVEGAGEKDEKTLEERTLHLLQDSRVDRELSEEKRKKKGGRKHKIRWMSRPMMIPEVILELQEEEYRENALRCLSNFLLERREQDPENYYRTGFLLFNSCSTMTILMQEILSFFSKMIDGSFNIRSSKRLINVLTLLQSVAANNETRPRFVRSCAPSFLVPLIQFDKEEEVIENVKAVALSIIGILCQSREPDAIQWALNSSIVEVCRSIIENGRELSKVISMHVLEAILQNDLGLSYICDPRFSHLEGLMETWNNLVTHLSTNQDYSPRLLFHIIRCFVLICAHERGHSIVTKALPIHLVDESFYDVREEFPVLENLLHQLLLNIGKEMKIQLKRENSQDQIREDVVERKNDCSGAHSVFSAASTLKSICI